MLVVSGCRVLVRLNLQWLISVCNVFSKFLKFVMLIFVRFLVVLNSGWLLLLFELSVIWESGMLVFIVLVMFFVGVMGFGILVVMLIMLFLSVNVSVCLKRDLLWLMWVGSSLLIGMLLFFRMLYSGCNFFLLLFI